MTFTYIQAPFYLSVIGCIGNPISLDTYVRNNMSSIQIGGNRSSTGGLIFLWSWTWKGA